MHSSEKREWRNSLLAELTGAQTLAMQLQAHLEQPSRIELCKSLASEILSSINKSISMAKPRYSNNEKQAVALNDPKDEMKAMKQSKPDNDNQAVERIDEETEKQAVDSNVVIVESSQSSLGLFFMDQIPNEKCKKRKTSLPTWNITTPYFDDRFIWRKYGQKLIHGAKYPRMYYRCNHGDTTDACTAKNQIQQLSDEDPPVFDVTYFGTHSCQRKFQLPPTLVHQEQGQQRKQPNSERSKQQSHVLNGYKDSMQITSLVAERNAEKCSSNITCDHVVKPMHSGHQQLQPNNIVLQQVNDTTVPVQTVPYIEFSIISKKLTNVYNEVELPCSIYGKRI